MATLPDWCRRFYTYVAQVWLGLARDVTAGDANFAALPGLDVRVELLPEEEEPDVGELWLRGPTVMPQPYVGLSDEVPAGARNRRREVATCLSP